MTINISGLASLIIGLLAYLWLGDYTVFSWADPWLYVYMVFWPFILIYYFFLWVAGIAIVCGIVYWLMKTFTRSKKRIR